MFVRNNLRVLMAKKKMNIQDVADRTKMSRTTVSKLYNETSNTVGFDTIVKLCNLFGCEVDDLFYLSIEPPTNQEK